MRNQPEGRLSQPEAPQVTASGCLMSADTGHPLSLPAGPATAAGWAKPHPHSCSAPAPPGTAPTPWWFQQLNPSGKDSTGGDGGWSENAGQKCLPDLAGRRVHGDANDGSRSE